MSTTVLSGQVRRRRFLAGIGGLVLWTVRPDLPARAADIVQPGPAEILQEMRRFREMGSVLYVAAHPDDENTQLITYLARGRGCRTAYLSLTRGDGGQNVLGGEFGAQLGLIRTQELLAARRLDGGRQFFTRALDFGFSKDYKETLNVWDHKQVLADVVRVIRTFRPDVIITRFAPEPSGTHGHHTASAVVANEAFKLAGDPEAFPEQLTDLKPWQPKRILQNGGGGGSNPFQMEIGGNDPVLGQSFGQIAGRSRGMHKSQGFGNGGGGGGGSRLESFSLRGGDPATKDILEGVDTTWNRVSGGGDVDHLIGEAIEKFATSDPPASLPALLKIRLAVSALPADPLVDEKRHDLDRLIQHCAGLTFETLIPQAEVTPGETLKLRHTVSVSSAVPVRWLGMRYPATEAQITHTIALQRGQSAVRESAQVLPATTPPSQPYWLREEPTAGMFRVDDPKLIGRPENPPLFPVEYRFEIGGQILTLTDEPVQVLGDERRRRLEVISPVSLQPTTEVRLFAPGSARIVAVDILAARPNVTGVLRLDVPAGWKVEPASQPFHLGAARDKASASFTLHAPAQPTTADIVARADINGATFSAERIEIKYPHIPVLLLQPPARMKAVALDCAIRGKQVAYLPGAGDSVANGLEQMGYTVTSLTGGDLTAERLRRFDALVTGVRAFNVRTDLSDGTAAALAAYAESGGTVVVQYNRPEGLRNKVAPLDLRLSTLRITDENAPVTFLAPDHPALNTPNRITKSDFDGWVQERGIYFPSEWDARFTPLLSSADPGEEPLKGGLLVAKYGQGYYVYTGLVFFRQLPAGVPGAYRLLANLVSLGK